MTVSARLYSLLCMAGESASVCKRAPTVSSLFVNICEMSCVSILAFDLTSCEAISTILLEVKTEYWYEKIDIANTRATTMASIIILVLSLRHFFKISHLLLYSSNLVLVNNNFPLHHTLLYPNVLRVLHLL
jgi:hypothetical protein